MARLLGDGAFPSRQLRFLSCVGTVVWSAGVLTQGRPWTELAHIAGGSREGAGGGQPSSASQRKTS